MAVALCVHSRQMGIPSGPRGQNMLLLPVEYIWLQRTRLVNNYTTKSTLHMERKWCGGRGWRGAEPKSPPKPAVWCTPVLSTAWEGTQRREDHGIEASVSHRVGPCSRKQKETQSKRGRLEDKGTFWQAQGHEFNPQAPHGER